MIWIIIVCISTVNILFDNSENIWGHGGQDETGVQSSDLKPT